MKYRRPRRSRTRNVTGTGSPSNASRGIARSTVSPRMPRPADRPPTASKPISKASTAYTQPACRLTAINSSSAARTATAIASPVGLINVSHIFPLYSVFPVYPVYGVPRMTRQPV